MSALLAVVRDVRVRATTAGDPALSIDLLLPDGRGAKDKIVLYDAAKPKRIKKHNASIRKLRALCGAAGVELVLPPEIKDAADLTPLAESLHGKTVSVEINERRVRYVGTVNAEPRPTMCVEEAQAWERKLARSGKDDEKYAGSLGNAILVLANHTAWRDTLAFDEFAGIVVCDKVPPWDDAAMPANAKEGPWADTDTARARGWFEPRYPGMRVSRTDTNDAVRVVALKRSRHPVRDRLNDCAANWDGVARDDTWLIRLGGAPDTPLVRAQSAKFLISAVARIMEPGCQVDHVLVLRGPTGGKKTSALRALAMRNEWFHDEVDPVTKDGKIALAGGVWIALDDEFAGLRGGNERKKKSYVTRRIEKFRSPYDVWDKRHARQCVLTAAVNEDEILSDPTGGRRYWIVDVQGFDIAALVAEVEQLWAEAVHRYRAGEKWHLVEPKLVAAAAMVQEGARTRDAWEEPVAKRLAKKSAGEGVTTHDILRGIENDERIEHSADELRDAELRIANLLRTLGWQKCDASRNRRGHLRDGVRVRLFFKGGKCPKCGRRERGEESEKRENDGHHGHSLEIKDKKVRPPPDNTPDTPGQSASGATSENGAAKAAYAAPLDSLGTAQVATAPLLARERGRRRITARERANANGEGARSR